MGPPAAAPRRLQSYVAMYAPLVFTLLEQYLVPDTLCTQVGGRADCLGAWWAYCRACDGNAVLGHGSMNVALKALERVYCAHRPSC